MSSKVRNLDNSHILFRRILVGEICEFLLERDGKEFIVQVNRAGGIVECYEWFDPAVDAEVKGPALLSLKQAALSQFAIWDALTSRQRIDVVCSWCEEHTLACAARIRRFMKAVGSDYELCNLSEKILLFAEELERAHHAADVAHDMRGSF